MVTCQVHSQCPMLNFFLEQIIEKLCYPYALQLPIIFYIDRINELVLHSIFYISGLHSSVFHRLNLRIYSSLGHSISRQVVEIFHFSSIFLKDFRILPCPINDDSSFYKW